MGTLRSCDHLRNEHRLIERVVAGLETLPQGDGGAAGLPGLLITGAVDFFSGFVARCHRPKEQEALFPALVASSPSHARLVETVSAQGDEAHRLLERLGPLARRQPVSPEAWGLLNAYGALLRRHIEAEERDVFPLADQMLSAAEDATLERRFREIEEREIRRGGGEALVALAGAVVHASESLATDPPAVPAGLLARHVMRPRTGTIGPDDSLARAADLMQALGTRELPVVAAGALVGMLTRTDMEPHRGHYEWTAVRAAMTAEPVSVAPDTPLPAVTRLVLDRGFNAVPVSEGGRLQGVISRTDLLRALASER
jgi:CBS domain-containing protein